MRIASCFIPDLVVQLRICFQLPIMLAIKASVLQYDLCVIFITTFCPQGELWWMVTKIEVSFAYKKYNNREWAMQSTKVWQDSFLKELCEDKASVSIFLVNGIKLHGVIDDYDEQVVMLKNSIQVYFFSISYSHNCICSCLKRPIKKTLCWSHY